MSTQVHQTPLELIAEDFSVSSSPLVPPNDQSQRILVIGGGVTGLTTAWALLDQGYHVTIISKEWASYGNGPRLTSQIAGALWETPPAGCGPQAVQEKLEIVQRWAMETLAVFQAIAGDPTLSKLFGLRTMMQVVYHLNKIDEDPIKTARIELMKRHKVPGLGRGHHIFDKYGVNVDSHGGLQDAYEHLAPMIDTDVAMAYILRLLRAKGARMVTDTIHGDLLHQEASLLKMYGADAVVNATGVWARETAADDSVFPLRGALLRVINDGTDFPKMEQATVLSSASTFGGQFRDMAFIVPRNDSILLLGSLLQKDEWELDLTVDSQSVRDMRARCEDLYPQLKNARLDPRYPLAQGRRPMREASVRLEREDRATPSGEKSRIVHAYGHGGGGWSFSFGSARDVARLIRQSLANEGERLLSKM